jgi:hypothetical protein
MEIHQNSYSKIGDNGQLNISKGTLEIATPHGGKCGMRTENP